MGHRVPEQVWAHRVKSPFREYERASSAVNPSAAICGEPATGATDVTTEATPGQHSKSVAPWQPGLFQAERSVAEWRPITTSTLRTAARRACHRTPCGLSARVVRGGMDHGGSAASRYLSRDGHRVETGD